MNDGGMLRANIKARHRVNGPGMAQEVQLPCAPHPTAIGPLLRQLARQADVKNKAYQACPVGQVAAKYLRALEYSGLAPNSVLAYEQVLAWLATSHDDLDDIGRFCDPGGADLLEEFLHVNWGHSAETTKAHRWKILKVFFDWCKDPSRELVPFNPMLGIRRPKSPRTAKQRQAYQQDIVQRLIVAQEPLRDRCALGLLQLALRKNDLRMLQLGDIDLVNDLIYLNHGKGGKRAVLPIVLDDVRLNLAAHMVERHIEREENDLDGEYLLYARNRRRRPMDQSAVHRWFKRMLHNADLPDSMEMHELRHTALDHVWRETGNIVVAQKLARHSSPATTAAYLHPNEDDLRAGLKLAFNDKIRAL